MSAVTSSELTERARVTSRRAAIAALFGMALTAVVIPLLAWGEPDVANFMGLPIMPRVACVALLTASLMLSIGGVVLTAFEIADLRQSQTLDAVEEMIRTQKGRG